MKSSAPTQRAPGGKDSLCDSCEPSGHPIPICGSGSESERNVLAHRSACCRRCALRRRLAIGSLGAGNPQCHLLLPAFAGIQQRTALRSSLRVLSASRTTAAFSAAFGSLQKRQPTADAVMKATSQPRPGFFMTSPHPSKQHPSTRSPPAKIPAPQLPCKQSTPHTCHPCNKK